MFWFKSRTERFKVALPRSRMPIRRRSVVIHHYCPHTFNAGDHFVIRSIRSHLKRFLPEAVFVPKASAFNRGWGDPVRLTGKNLVYSNRYADAVVIGGSDQYNNWSLRIRSGEIRHLVPPLYLIGMGISSKQLGAPPHMEKKSYLKDMRVTHEVARMVSVRDEPTQRFLQELGIEKAVVTGCPAMHLFAEEFRFESGGVLALTFPFPVVRKNRPQVYGRLLDVIRHFLRHARDWGLRPVVVCHDDRDVHVAQEAFPEAELFFSNYVDKVIDFYRSTSVVLGSRLHATILAAGAGIPFVNIDLDARGEGFTQTFGLSGWNLPVEDGRLIQKLSDRVERIVSGDLHPFEELRARRDRYRRIFLDFMRGVARDILAVLGMEGEGA